MAAASSAALATPSSRASAAALAAQLVASAAPGSSAALNDATDILCASFPLLDPPVVRSVVAQHTSDAAAILAALCELAGEAPPSRAPLPAAGRCVATRRSAACEQRRAADASPRGDRALQRRAGARRGGGGCC